jgi:hypothetical protein
MIDRAFTKLTATLLQLTLCLIVPLAPSHSAPVVKDQKATNISASPKVEAGNTSTPAAKSKNMHRADFRVKGASCVACLRRISKTMRAQKGVIKGDVSIFSPYWAIVIFDGDQTNLDKVYESVKHEKVTFEDIEDRVVDGLPLIVIPKGMAAPQSPAKSK